MEDIISTLVVFLAWFFPLLVLAIARSRIRRSRKAGISQDLKRSKKRFTKSSMKKSTQKVGKGRGKEKETEKFPRGYSPPSVPPFRISQPPLPVKEASPLKKIFGIFPSVKPSKETIAREEAEALQPVLTRETVKPSFPGKNGTGVEAKSVEVPRKEASPEWRLQPLKRLSALKRAVVWAEILGPPKGLREGQEPWH